MIAQVPRPIMGPLKIRFQIQFTLKNQQSLWQSTVNTVLFPLLGQVSKPRAVIISAVLPYFDTGMFKYFVQLRRVSYFKYKHRVMYNCASSI